MSSSYSRMPREYTSVAVVTCSPRTCSGLAYSGVIICSPGAVAAASVWPESSAFRSLAMPKSSSFGTPSCVTRTLAGLMSRWMTRF